MTCCDSNTAKLKLGQLNVMPKRSLVSSTQQK